MSFTNQLAWVWLQLCCDVFEASSLECFGVNTEGGLVLFPHNLCSCEKRVANLNVATVARSATSATTSATTEVATAAAVAATTAATGVKAATVETVATVEHNA